VSERVAVVGSRVWWPPWIVHRFIDTLESGTTVVSGGAPGADTMAWAYVTSHPSKSYGIEEKIAQWDAYDNFAAGPIRNSEIVKASDWGVAFWDGKVERSGTLDCVRKFMAADKCVVMIWNRK
jgi:hypothetical protein